MADGVDPGDDKSPLATDAELHDEFLQDKLLRSKGLDPPMRLTGVHIRLGRRVFSVW